MAGLKKRSEKNAKPFGAHRVVISGANNNENADRNESLNVTDLSDIYEDINLEETPDAGLLKKEKKRPGKREKNEKIADKTILADLDRGYGGINRYRKEKKSIFSKLKSIPSIFKRKSSNNAALEFAGSGKRRTKRDKRNRRIAIYGGTGIIAVAAVLVITLTSGGAVAPAQASGSAGISPTTGTQTAAAVTSDQYSMNVPTTDSVEPTITITPTLPPTTPPDKTPIPFDPAEEAKTYMVKADKYYNQMGYSSNHYKYTPEEKSLLAQVIYQEACGEGREGMIAVGNVALNRALCSKFKHSLKYVLTSGQFAAPRGNTSSESRAAANYVLDWEVWVVPQNAYFFKVSSTKDDWGTRKYNRTINHHAFYTYSYPGRSRAKGVPPQLFERVYKWPQLGCMPEQRVYKLQTMLIKLGYNKVQNDKYFGQDTKDAIMDFQKKHKMKADGVAGEGTIKALIEAYGVEAYYDKFCKDKG